MKRILFIEDDEDILEAMSLFLRSKGYEVFAFPKIEGFNAYLTEINNIHPDLIISDIFVPNIDGRDLCKFVKQQDSLKKIPYLLISAGNFTQEEILTTCGDSFLAKPFDLKTFETTVAKFLTAA